MCTYICDFHTIISLLFAAILIAALVCIIQVALILNTARRMVQRWDYITDISYWGTFISKWWKNRRA